jgi:hypothetical protein
MRIALLLSACALAALTGAELALGFFKNDALAAALAVFPALLTVVVVREHGRR